MLYREEPEDLAVPVPGEYPAVVDECLLAEFFTSVCNVGLRLRRLCFQELDVVLGDENGCFEFVEDEVVDQVPQLSRELEERRLFLRGSHLCFATTSEYSFEVLDLEFVASWTMMPCSRCWILLWLSAMLAH